MTDGAARGDRDIRARGGCSHGVSAGVRSPTVQRQKAEQRDGHSGQRVARTACPGRCSEVPHAADLSWARTGRDHGSLSGPDCDSSHAALTSRKRQRKPSDPSRHRQEVLESTRWVVRVCAGQSTHRQVRSKEPAAERTRAGGPEVAGSNPAPATNHRRPGPSGPGLLSFPDATVALRREPLVPGDPGRKPIDDRPHGSHLARRHHVGKPLH